MWLFRNQFKMTASEKRGVCDLATFTVLIHLKAWITAPTAVAAPRNDFQLMGHLLKYPPTAISTATSHKLGLHMWYLSEELISLSLFDSRIPIKAKRFMIAAMKDTAPDHPPKRPRIESAAFLGNCSVFLVFFYKNDNRNVCSQVLGQTLLNRLTFGYL